MGSSFLSSLPPFPLTNLTVSPSETRMSAFAPLAFEITDFVFGKSRFKRPELHDIRMKFMDRLVGGPLNLNSVTCGRDMVFLDVCVYITIISHHITCASYVIRMDTCIYDITIISNHMI